MDEAMRGCKFACIRQTNSELKRELCRLRGGLAGVTVDDLSARARIKQVKLRSTLTPPEMRAAPIWEAKFSIIR